MNVNWNSIRKSDIFSHFASFKYLPRWLVLLVDVGISTFSYILASSVIFRPYLHFETLDSSFIAPLVAFIIVQIFYFWLFRTYSGILRYSSFIDTAKLLLSVFLNVITFIIVNIITYLLFDYSIYQLSSILFYGNLTFFLLFFVRLIVKNSFDYISTHTGKVMSVMIYGTDAPEIAIARMLRTNSEVNYRLAGFIDTNKNIKSKTLMGKKVYGLSEENVKNVISKKANAVITSSGKMSSLNLKTDLDIFINNGLPVLSVPSFNLHNGEAPSPREIKSIQIEDLLGRPQINLSTTNIAKEINEKVVLITGAAGSIGSEIVKQCIQFDPKHIILVDQAETPMHELILKLKASNMNVNFSTFLGDIRNKQRMEYIIKRFRPEIIFHAAAYKHVPLMEDNPTESIQTNVHGTKTIADLAVKYKVSRFVMISTDKAVNPTNIMGASKRIAEIYVQSLNNYQAAKGERSTKFITTRFGNVLGSNGSVIPLFRRQIEHKGPVTVTHPNVIRYFMTTFEASLLVLEAGTMGDGGEIFIFDMGEPVCILDLAKKMIRLAGYIPDKDIPIIFTGLRPGEKLYEELLNNKEITKETHNPKIMIANVKEYDYTSISSEIDELIGFSYSGKQLMTVSQIKSLVPEFKSSNPAFEMLDTVEQNSTI